MTARTRYFQSTLVAFSAVALFAIPARAQEASSIAPAPASAVVATARPTSLDSTNVAAVPSTDAASVAVRRPAAETRLNAAAAGRSSAPGTAFMIVGGAAILTGIVIGGDAGHAISIGGAVLGLIGLYQYLQ
jgi:hypothetical protein